MPFTLTLPQNRLSLWRSNAFVLEDLPFTLTPGEQRILQGPNGCGKSSLLKVLAGLIPSDPPIRYEGESPPLYLPSDSPIDSYMTAGEWVSFFYELLPPLHRLDSPTDALSWWHLDPHTPLGLLSAGQKQRLALCRLLYQKSPLWLLDEPTQHLDRQATHQLIELVEKHCQWGAAVIADHNLVSIAKPLSILTLTPYTRRPHVSSPV